MNEDIKHPTSKQLADKATAEMRQSLSTRYMEPSINVSPAERLAEIEAITRPLQDEATAIRQKILESKSAFVIGDIITWNHGRGRVIDIREWVCGQPLWIVRRIRKDGSEGAEYKVRDYMKPLLYTI